MSISNARMSIGAIFGSITATAVAVTNTIDTLNDGIGMLNLTVSDAAYAQKLRSTAERHSLKATILEEKSKERTIHQENIQNWASENPIRLASYQENYNQLQDLLKDL